MHQVLGGGLTVVTASWLHQGSPVLSINNLRGPFRFFSCNMRCSLLEIFGPNRWLSDPSGTDLHLVFSSSSSSSFSHLALLLLFPTSTCPRPPNPYIFWKLMIIAIQKRIGNTNTKTKTNTKTMTKTKTQREQLNHYQCAIFSESGRLKHSKSDGGYLPLVNCQLTFILNCRLTWKAWLCLQTVGSKPQLPGNQKNLRYI